MEPILIVASALVGTALGGVIGWLAAARRTSAAEATVAALRQQVADARARADLLERSLRDADARRVEHETAARELERNLAEQRRLLDEAEGKLGDTFQAVKSHRYADPLAEPGEADLTFHVDFGALAEAARGEGARIYGPVTQAEFLAALGIGSRGKRLKNERPEHAGDIDAAIDRLTNAAQMGTMFKVLALCAPDTPTLPGFPC